MNQADLFVLGEVLDERRRQDEKWGEQNHPDGTGEHSMPLSRIVFHRPAAPGGRHCASELALLAKEATDRAARAGMVTWTDILLEEVFEALAEDDSDKLRTELVQIAAVATQWVEAIDRRQRVPLEPTA